MISSFSDAGYLIRRRPISDHAFFEQPKLKRLLCYNLLQVTGFAAKVFNLVACRCTRCVTGMLLLSSYHEVLEPFII